MSGRSEPNKWTKWEDSILAKEVTKQSAHLQDNPDDLTDWNRIAAKLSGRTNKDCRKRWINSVCGGLKKGPWTDEEDRQILEAISKHGTKWTLVAKELGSRSADQCSKRWQHNLNPKLDHSKWTTSEEELLLQLVEQHGREWKRIQEVNYPTRSRNQLKNKYTILTRGKSAPDNDATRASLDEEDGPSPASSLAYLNTGHIRSSTSDFDFISSATSSGDFDFTHNMFDVSYNLPEQDPGFECIVPNFTDFPTENASMAFSPSFWGADKIGPISGGDSMMGTSDMEGISGTGDAFLDGDLSNTTKLDWEQANTPEKGRVPPSENKLDMACDSQPVDIRSVTMRIEGCDAEGLKELIETSKKIKGQIEMEVKF